MDRGLGRRGGGCATPTSLRSSASSRRTCPPAGRVRRGGHRRCEPAAEREDRRSRTTSSHRCCSPSSSPSSSGASVTEVPIEQLANRIDPGTDLVAFSLVDMQTGRVAPAADIIVQAQAAGERVLIDATHGIPFVDPLAANADFVVCAAYKHLLCPGDRVPDRERGPRPRTRTVERELACRRRALRSVRGRAADTGGLRRPVRHVDGMAPLDRSSRFARPDQPVAV